MRRTTMRTTAKLATITMSLAAAATLFAGAANAEAPDSAPIQVTPVSEGIPLDPVATNPNAMFPDPALNGAAAGALTGSAGGAALGSVVGSIPGALGGSALGALIGGGIGALVGLLDPNAIPQVLP
ncbi:hypothetical protein ABZ412_18410 [Nocardia sp. NPDC005746]|uniref:hypothetical protein n=1 Tax=unclassified Nocardia TaxID=2637762 RepID=UPI0033C17286